MKPKPKESDSAYKKRVDLQNEIYGLRVKNSLLETRASQLDDSLKAEHTKIRCLNDRLDQQEKTIERLWVHKALVGLKLIEHLSSITMNGEYYLPKVKTVVAALLKDMPATLMPEWEGERK